MINYRHLIAVEQAIDTQDATGDPVRTWLATRTVPASIEPMRGREFGSGAALLGEMDTRIKFRWAPAYKLLDAKWRIRDTHRGTIYNIVSVAEVNLEQREFEVMAKSGINAG